MRPNFLRLEVSSWGERALLVGQAFGLFGMVVGGLFMLLSSLDGLAAGWGLISFILGGLLLFGFSLVASFVDDTYMLHFPTRCLMYQNRGPFGAKLKKVRSFDEIAAVGVDFRWSPWVRTDGFYCVVMVDDRGRKIRISDWEHDRWGGPMSSERVDRSYLKMSQLAAQVSQAGPWRLVDRGPSQSLLAESPRRGVVHLSTEDWSIISNFLGLLGFLIWAWFVVPDLFRELAPR